MTVVKNDRTRGKEDYAADKHSQDETNAAQIEIQRRDPIKPTDAGNQTNKGARRHPGLDRSIWTQRYSEILRNGRSPLRHEEPSSRQKRDRGAANQSHKQRSARPKCVPPEGWSRKRSFGGLTARSRPYFEDAPSTRLAGTPLSVQQMSRHVRDTIPARVEGALLWRNLSPVLP